MQHKIFTIYDTKAEAYFPPFYLPQSSMAIRQFGDMVNDSNSSISKHPADYTLFELGEWDDNSSEFVDLNKKSLGNGIEFISNPDENA